jgi:hypothetical protein
MPVIHALFNENLLSMADAFRVDLIGYRLCKKRGGQNRQHRIQTDREVSGQHSNKEE